MKYFLIINNKTNEIFGKSRCFVSNENIKCIEVFEDVFENSEKYMYDGENIVLDPNYEEILAQKERERLNSLSLTAADVERAIYKAKGMDFDDVLELAKQANEIQTVSLADDEPVDKIDIKALKIELKANSFYRDDLDYLFKNKELPSKEQQ